MHTIELDDDELRLVVSAVRAFLEDVGHDGEGLRWTLDRLVARLEPT